MVDAVKQATRRTALEARSRRTDVPGAAAESWAFLNSMLDGARLVASYVPLPGEPGLAPRPGWLLPVLLPNGDLDWAVHDGRLRSGRSGLQEPAGARLGVDALTDCDLVIVPALLVDRCGSRLGRGGGSYDRALPRTSGLRLALLHDGELVEQVPVEPHDVQVHAAATPSLGVVRLWGG